MTTSASASADVVVVGAGPAGLAAAWTNKAAAEAADDDKQKTTFKLYPIGKVEKEGQSVRLRIFDEHVDGLLGLDGWSHVNVFYWFDKNDTPMNRGILRVHPRGDKQNPLTGVFACRAPVRPNLIALSVCKVVSVQGGLVQVDVEVTCLDRPVHSGDFGGAVPDPVRVDTDTAFEAAYAELTGRVERLARTLDRPAAKPLAH